MNHEQVREVEDDLAFEQMVQIIFTASSWHVHVSETLLPCEEALMYYVALLLIGTHSERYPHFQGDAS